MKNKYKRWLSLIVVILVILSFQAVSIEVYYAVVNLIACFAVGWTHGNWSYKRWPDE